MAKNDQEEAFEKALTGLLTRILDNQKFAEAKNAGLLALNSAWGVAAANLMFSGRAIPHSFLVGISIAFPLLLISGLLCLASLLPRLNLTRLLRNGPFREPCLIYFGDIATLKPADYINRVRERYMPKEKSSANEAYLNDLAGQIAANSAITNRKFKLFNWAAISAATAWAQ